MEAVDEARLRGVDEPGREVLETATGSVFATPSARADRVLGGVDGLRGQRLRARAT